MYRAVAVYWPRAEVRQYANVQERSRSTRDPGRGQQRGPERAQAGASGASFPRKHL